MAEGDIGAVIDSLEFDPVLGQYTSIVHVSGGVYAIAYHGPDDDGWVKTITINDDGSIDDAVIDSFEFETDNFWNGTIGHVANSVFAIVYRGVTNHGWLKTITINNDGSIDYAVIDSFEFDAFTCDEPELIQISGNVFAVSYQGESSYGRIKTITINDNGSIDGAVIDSLVFYAGAIMGAPMTRVGSGNIYALSSASSSTTFVKTITINDNGSIDDAVIDTIELEATTAGHTSIVAITNNIFAVAYRGPLADGWLKTITINDDGSIDDAVIDSFEFDVADCNEPELIRISGNVFVIAYITTSYVGCVKTVTINDDGSIDGAVIDSLNFETVQCFCPDPIHVIGSIYAIAYRGPDIDGWVKTVDIETIPAGRPHHLEIMGVD